MLELKDISLIFEKGTSEERKALDNINLKVEDGAFITIIGSNGAGKSTLFNVIAGSLKPSRGSVLLDEENITQLPSFKRSKFIGRLFQDPHLGTAGDMTIEENLFLSSGRGGMLGKINKKDRELFREKLKELGMHLEDHLEQKVGLLSGGQRQALTLLMATFNPPRLLLLDEHTAALDPESANKILFLTNKIVKENNITCLMITHNMDMALKNGERTLLLNRGHIAFDLKGDERRNTTVNNLLEMFKEKEKESLSSDEMLL